MHYVSSSLKPIKVQTADGKVRIVKHGEPVPEAMGWKDAIRSANVRMGILREVHADGPAAAAPSPAPQHPVAAHVKIDVSSPQLTPKPAPEKKPEPGADDPAASPSGAKKGK